MMLYLILAGLCLAMTTRKLAPYIPPARELERFGRIARPEPGDVILTRGRSWISRAIRLMTRERSEPPTVVNHAGMVVKAAATWASCEVVEALGAGVTRRKLGDGYNLQRDRVQVWRYCGPSEGLAFAAAKLAERRVGQRYGYVKLLLHAGDWLVTRGRFKLFRRLGRVDRWPICSYLVAVAFEEARTFQDLENPEWLNGDTKDDFPPSPPMWPGFNSYAMTPDDLHDVVTGSPDWTLVRPGGSTVE